MIRRMFGKKDKRRGHDYFLKLTNISKDSDLFSLIASSIEDNGHWEESIEWRIFTDMKSRIDLEKKNEKIWYRVSVNCDHEFVCHTQTLDRAVYLLSIYKLLIMDMFYNLGWASSSEEQIKERGYMSW